MKLNRTPKRSNMKQVDSRFEGLFQDSHTSYFDVRSESGLENDAVLERETKKDTSDIEKKIYINELIKCI